MTVNTPEPTAKSPEDWAVNLDSRPVLLVLSESELADAGLDKGYKGNHKLMVSAQLADTSLPNDMVAKANIIVLEISPEDEASQQRFTELRAGHPHLPVIAAIRDFEPNTIRKLMHQGAYDVISLPLSEEGLETTLNEFFSARKDKGTHYVGALTAVIKSLGGVGSTTIATHLATLLADKNKGGRGVCLIDLDLQFGEVATYLGLDTTLTIANLLDAGTRIDRELLRSVMAKTPSGLYVLQSPADILPPDSIDQDQIIRIVELARSEYDHVILDLPTEWSNWSLSLLSMANQVLLVVEMSIASLHSAKRQLRLLNNQGISIKKVHVVANRVRRRLFQPIGLEAAAQALGHPVNYNVRSDYELVNNAQNQGVLINEVNSKSSLWEDYEKLLPILTGAEKD